MDRESVSGPLFWILVAMAGTGLATLHIILPALASIAEEFGVTFGRAQLTLSLCMLAMAVSTLATGPLSDLLGRRPVFLLGLALMLAGSVASALAGSIEMLVAARMLQGVGGVTGLILGPAVIRDLHQGAEAARKVNDLIIGQTAGPAAAPIIGSLIVVVAPWPSLFWLYAAISLVLLAFAHRYLPETRKPDDTLTGRFRRYIGHLLAESRFWAAVLVGGFAVSIFFSIVSASSWAFSLHFDLDPVWFTVLMTVFSSCFIAGNLLNGRLVSKLSSESLTQWGVIGLTVSLTSLAAMVLTGIQPVWMLPGCAVFAFSNGLVIPNSVAIGIDVYPRAAGTASGVMVAIHMAMGAAITQVMGVALDAQGLPAVVWAFAATLCGAWICVAVLWRTRRAQD